MSATIGDGTLPVYNVEWTDGSSRDTAELNELVRGHEELDVTAIENLVELARADDETESVELVGFE